MALMWAPWPTLYISRILDRSRGPQVWCPIPRLKPPTGSPLLKGKVQAPWPTSPLPSLSELPCLCFACLSSRLQLRLVALSSLLSVFEGLSGGTPHLVFNCWFTFQLPPRGLWVPQEVSCLSLCPKQPAQYATLENVNVCWVMNSAFSVIWLQGRDAFPLHCFLTVGCGV